METANTPALFRGPTKAFEDTLALDGINLKVFKMPGALPVEGGRPFVLDGKTV